jgi:hypothetical protein
MDFMTLIVEVLTPQVLRHPEIQKACGEGNMWTLKNLLSIFFSHFASILVSPQLLLSEQKPQQRLMETRIWGQPSSRLDSN